MPYAAPPALPWGMPYPGYAPPGQPQSFFQEGPGGQGGRGGSRRGHRGKGGSKKEGEEQKLAVEERNRERNLRQRRSAPVKKESSDLLAPVASGVKKPLSRSANRRKKQREQRKEKEELEQLRSQLGKRGSEGPMDHGQITADFSDHEEGEVSA